MSHFLEPIAIVGIGCKLPAGATMPQDFWEVLKQGICGIGSVPEDRWSLDRFYDKNKAALGKASTHWGGFIDGIRDFDAEFFGISPREAEAMDPQQRMLLLTTWRAFEDAGIPIERLRGSNTSVHVGISGTDYTVIQRFRRTGENMHAGPGGAMSVAANRISHKFDFRGPSVAVDTACSSSLVATDLACQTIWTGKSDIAVAAGVNALLDPGVFVNFSKANMMSPTGRIKTFDASADGYVRAEGCGVIVLKRLSQAIADNDRVYALIRATCVNQDGNTSTITIPSADAQTDMLLTACKTAGLRPEDVDYVEAHGTGTPVGDPIEAHAIGKAFGANRARKRPVIVGAGKTNTGHLESAAGVTGVIKTALSLYHRQIPRNINFKSPNPEIPFDDLRLDLPLRHQNWIADTGRPRRGAVNSFGFGGTNACAVMEEAPHETARPKGYAKTSSTWFIPFGAQTESALRASAAQIASTIEAAGDDKAAEVFANLAVRRSHMKFRGGAIAGSSKAAAENFRSFAKGKAAAKDTQPQFVMGRKLDAPKLVMSFAGQGGAWWGMAHDLLANDPVFQNEVAAIDEIFEPLAGWSIQTELMKSERDYRNSTVYSLPGLFALQLGLVAKWKAWGVRPDLVIGHSSGEMAAAHAAGILSLEDAVRLTFARAKLQGTQEGRGAIAAIALSRAAVEGTLAKHRITRVDFAGINGPEMINLAGDADALDLAIEKLKQEHGEDLFARVLKMTFAPHSHHMDAIRTQFLAETQTLKPLPGHTPMVSTVTGRMLIGPMADSSYWWRNVRDTVLFDSGLREVLRLGGNAFLEIGPHLNLAAMISPVVAEKGSGMPVVTSLKRGEPAERTMLSALGTLFSAGIEPDWTAMYGSKVEPVALPAYPFELKPFWIESEESQHALYGPKSHPLLGFRTLAPQPSWSNELSLDEHKYLNGHVIDGSVIFPGAGYVEIMFGVAREVLGDGVIELENVEILDAMILSNEKTEMLNTEFEPVRNRVSIYSRQRGSNLDWTLRARGVARIISGLHAPAKRKTATPRTTPMAGAEVYKRVATAGYVYGPGFRAVKALYRGEKTATAVLKGGPTEGYHFHPGRLDSALHAGFGLGDRIEAAGGSMYLPVRIERAVLFEAAPKGQMTSICQSVDFDETQSIMDYQILGSAGEPVLEIQGFTTRALSIGARPVKRDVSKPAFVSEEWVEADIKASKSNFPLKGQSWIVIGGGNATSRSRRIEAEIVKSGAKSVFVDIGGRSSGGHSLNPADPAAFGRLLKDLKAAGEIPRSGPRGILFARPLDLDFPKGPYDKNALKDNEAQSTNALLNLVKTLAAGQSMPRLWVLTRGVVLTDGEVSSNERIGETIVRGPIAGMVRTVLTEHAGLRASLVDLESDDKRFRDQAARLAPILGGGTDETEIALRDRKTFVPRVKMDDAGALPPLLAPAAARKDRHYRLAMTRPGDLDLLLFAETGKLELGPDDVRVAIKAGGLNFRDVMAATALLPADAESGIPTESLGLEAAGLVVETGANVTTIKPGDRVMTTSKGCFRSEAVVPADTVHQLPKAMSYVEAATVPSAFATAYFGLVHLARIRPGETVLVHMGTGGVGLAAIQIAKLKGAVVISTAGSDEKRTYLRKLGIKHVFDSRALDFAQHIRMATGGRGVDIVLNALAGDAIPMGISLLAPNGRFVEIGKRDIYGDSAVGLRAFRHNVTFFALDMARMDRDDPVSLAKVYQEVLDHFAAGRLTPLPALTFKASKVRDAFKAMAQAKHIGKVVVDFDDPELRIGLSRTVPLALDPNAAYVVIGGLGGFGGEVAKFLAERGAKHLFLVRRSGADSPEAKAILADLARMDVKAHAVSADIADAAAVRGMIETIARAGLSLRGVVHSAMVLDDGFIDQLDASRMLRVLEPKVLGAWNLHHETKELPLDFFVMFSSMAATIGSSGQANYVAANRTLDFLAAHRRAMGLPALTVNWGALGGAGAVQRNKAILKYLKTMGMPPLDLNEALNGLEIAMRADVPQLGCCKIDWHALARANAGMVQIPRFGDVVSTGEQASGSGRIRSELLAAKGAERQTLLNGYVAKQIARVLKIDVKQLQMERPLNELGLDSLTSFQLKNKIESDVGVSLPVGKFLQKPTISSLSAVLGQVLEASAQTNRKGAAQGTEKSSGPVMSPRQEWLWQRIREDGVFPAHAMMELIYALEVSFLIDIDMLDKAFKKVVSKHEVLRSSFPQSQGKPSVVLLPVGRFSVIEAGDAEESDAALMTRLDQLANTPHNLETGPLIDIHVFRRKNGRNVLVLRSHVIVTDGWSFGAVLRDVFQGYFGLGDAAEDEAPSYFKFAREQRLALEGPAAKASHAFWRDTLKSLPPPICFGDKPSAVNPRSGGRYVKRYVPAAGGFDPRGAARSIGVSMHAMLAAAFHVHLHMATGARDITLVSNVANRTTDEQERMVGWFANHLLVRCGVDPLRSFRAHAQTVAEAYQRPLEHAGYPAHLVLEAAAESNGGSVPRNFIGFSMMWPDNAERTGFESIMFAPPGRLHRFGELELTMLPAGPRSTGHFLNDAAVTYQELDGEFLVSLHSRDGVFEKGRDEEFLDAYVAILKTCIAYPDAIVADLAKDLTRRGAAE